MNEMTREQKQKLCDIYNGSDIEALDYMYEFLKDNHNPEMLELILIEGRNYENSR